MKENKSTDNINDNANFIKINNNDTVLNEKQRLEEKNEPKKIKRSPVADCDDDAGEVSQSMINVDVKDLLKYVINEETINKIETEGYKVKIFDITELDDEKLAVLTEKATMIEKIEGMLEVDAFKYLMTAVIQNMI